MNEVISDEHDLASHLEQMASDMKVKEIQAIASKPIPTSDKCLWCDRKTVDGRRWCNADCRNMHQEFGCQ